MVLASLSPGSATASLDRPDWVTIGLVLAIVGSFLLANAILFRNPRGMVEQIFGGAQLQLRSIREYIFHRVQVTLGFLFLLVGFGLQLYGHYDPPRVAVGGDFPALWVGLILLVAVALQVLGWMLSHNLFRRYVRDYLLRHQVNFEADMKLAREVGELFGLETSGDETVQSYVARLNRRLGLDAAQRRRASVVILEPVAPEVGDEELA